MPRTKGSKNRPKLTNDFALPLKSSRFRAHGCFWDALAICNKMNEQYVPVGRGHGLYSLFPHVVPLPSDNEAAVWSGSAIPPLQLL